MPENLFFMLIPIYVVGNTLQMPLFWFNSFLCIRAKTKLVPQPKEFLVGKRKEEYSRIFSKALESGHTLNCAKEENKIRLNEWIYRTFVCDVTFYLHYRRAKLVVEEHLVVMHRRELSLKMVFFFPMNWGMTTNIVAKIYCPLLARAHTAAREVLVTSEKKKYCWIKKASFGFD